MTGRTVGCRVFLQAVKDKRRGGYAREMIQQFIELDFDASTACFAGSRRYLKRHAAAVSGNRQKQPPA
jgi:hypothetical protein